MASCKYCNRPFEQAPGGHRRREYCDDTCKQSAYRTRRERELREERERRWSHFTPETRSFLDWLTLSATYGADVAANVEHAIHRETARYQDIITLSDREQGELQFMALGSLQEPCYPCAAFSSGKTAGQWRCLVIPPGAQAWREFAHTASDEQLARAIVQTRRFYQAREEEAAGKRHPPGA